MALDSSGYSAGSASAGVAGSEKSGAPEQDQYWSLRKLKQGYLDYLGNKRDEIEEQKKARRYRHGAHWTEEQIKVLQRRKQPVVTYNRIGRKIDGIIGLVAKLRLDPKAYPRTPQHQQGADLATAVLRYVMDTAEFKYKDPQAAERAAINGIGGVELEIVPGDKGDPDITLNLVDEDGFFYDPRSFELDFSDALYMGQGKWVDQGTLEEIVGEDASADSGGISMDLTTNSDRDNKWFFTVGNREMIRLVDMWYRNKGKWCWALFTGTKILQQGESPFKNEKGKSVCKFFMFSAAVDHDGDRYGFPRNLIPVNDEINIRRSKALHEVTSRRMIATRGAFDDMEKVRLEASRPDGIILKNPGTDVEFDDQAKQLVITGQLEMLKEAKAEIENFGPNPAILGDSGIKNQSGKAIQLLQQAGIAELGPYFNAYRGWKMRLYRAVWNAVQQYWTSERWVRVTDDMGLAQYVQINAMQPGPFGPQIVNQVGVLDVDIILDEGPDTVTMMQDVYETLGDIMPSVAKIIPPGVATAMLNVLLQNSPLPADAKKQIREAASQPPPPPPEMMKLQVDAKMKQAELAHEQQKTQLEHGRKQQEAQMNFAIKRQEADNDMEIERVKAANSIQLEREKAHNQMAIQKEQGDLDREKAAADVTIQAHKHKHDMEMGREKMDMEKQNAKSKSEAAMPQSAVLVKALEQLGKPRKSEEELVKTLSALASEIKNMNKPRPKGQKRVTKNRDGSFSVQEL